MFIWLINSEIAIYLSFKTKKENKKKKWDRLHLITVQKLFLWVVYGASVMQFY